MKEGSIIKIVSIEVVAKREKYRHLRVRDITVTHVCYSDEDETEFFKTDLGIRILPKEKSYLITDQINLVALNTPMIRIEKDFIRVRIYTDKDVSKEFLAELNESIKEKFNQDHDWLLKRGFSEVEELILENYL